MLEQPAAQTIVSFLLDRTGSMGAIKAETTGGFNAYLDTLEREAGKAVEFTLLQFDSQSIDVLCRGVRLADVPHLTPETYQPRAYTPLIDACWQTIKETEEAVAGRRGKPQVVIVFQSDGAENASRHHQLDELRALIGRRTAEGWQFVFLGADIDAYAAAQQLGILADSTIAYRGRDSERGMGVLAEATANFARGRARQMRFSDKQKHAAGDRHAAKPVKADAPIKSNEAR